MNSPSLPSEIDGIRVPGLRDVYRAKARIRPYLSETPVLQFDALDELLHARLFLKCEHVQPTGAFKVRGGVNLIGSESDAGVRGDGGPNGKARGFVTASTGNHGQSIAYACRLFGADAYVFVPENPNPVKAEAMRRLGARVIEEGDDFNESIEAAVAYADDHGLHFVHSIREPRLVEGVATYTLELLRKVPDLDALIVPVGAGSGACGAAIVAKAVCPDIEVIAVQAQAAPAVCESWRTGQVVTDGQCDTEAEGMATRVPDVYPVTILRALLDDFVLVSDDDMREAVRLLLYSARQVVEESGAAALAAAMKLGERLRGRNVGIVLSGGNIAEERLRAIAAGG